MSKRKRHRTPAEAQAKWDRNYHASRPTMLANRLKAEPERLASYKETMARKRKNGEESSK